MVTIEQSFEKNEKLQKSMNDSVFRMNCWFEGRVQGVGFRYSTLQVAKGFEVAGTVKNLSDGRVELLAEGEESEVKAFQQALAEEMSDYIRKVEIRTSVGFRTVSQFRILT